MTRIDRAATTPFLLRIFSKHGGFHDLGDFDSDRRPSSERHVYAWKDMTLGQLTDLLIQDLIVEESETCSSYKLSYRLVYGDTSRLRYDTRSLGTVQVSYKSLDHEKTLGTAQFVIGDWLDVAILKPGDRLYDADLNRPSRQSRGRQTGHRAKSYSSTAWTRDDGGRSRDRDNTKPYGRRRGPSRSRHGDGSGFRDRHRASDAGRW